MSDGLFAERVVAGSRIYFFDVKVAEDGVKYLVISELRRVGLSYDRGRVMIFEEHLEIFSEGFQKALRFLGLGSSVAGRRYSRSYERWTSHEDDQLRSKYRAGVGIYELAVFFQRRPGAIRSRLLKLGLFVSKPES